jgi:hypothetical protein
LLSTFCNFIISIIQKKQHQNLHYLLSSLSTNTKEKRETNKINFFPLCFNNFTIFSVNKYKRNKINREREKQINLKQRRKEFHVSIIHRRFLPLRFRLLLRPPLHRPSPLRPQRRCFAHRCTAQVGGVV